MKHLCFPDVTAPGTDPSYFKGQKKSEGDQAQPLASTPWLHQRESAVCP